MQILQHSVSAGITAAGSYQYRSYITNCSGANNATSNVATLTVNPYRQHQPLPTMVLSALVLL